MPSFQDKPVISFIDLETLLKTIYDTYNINGSINTFQLHKITCNGIGNALFTALRTTNSKDGFETNLIKQKRAMQGIANTFAFKLEPEWNITNEHGRFMDDKVPSVNTKMSKILVLMANKYGVTTEVKSENVSDIIEDMMLEDITDNDIKWNDMDYKNKLHIFIRENRKNLKTEFPDMKGAELKEQAMEQFPKPEPSPAYDRLEADATDFVNKAKTLYTETWEKVKNILDIDYPDVDINALHGTDGLTGSDRYYLVQAILRNFDWAQESSKAKLCEIEMDPEMEKDRKMAQNNYNSAVSLIPMCNMLINSADEVYKSNTSDEFSRMFEEGSSDNVSEDGLNRHVYETEHNLIT